MEIIADSRSPVLGVCIWYLGGESTVLRGSIESRGIDFCSRHAPDLLDRSSLQLAASRWASKWQVQKSNDQKYT